MLSPGDKVNDYEVIAPLGSGGMAMLYLARRRGVGGFSRLVTLKLVHQHLVEDENVTKRFLDEARISAHVAHPNVVHVEEVGQYSGGYFIAMEYVHGVSLAELLARLTERRLRLHRKLCVWIAVQVAEALHAAHEAKSECGVPLDIVHRDVSPQNVLIGHTGHVKLIDFGIARSQAEANHRSGTLAVLGKLRYMSPEQLQLERADRRTDVYALGVMLWEMLAGRNLLRCQRFDDERDWATRENPPPPSLYSSHSNPQLDRVVQKALACDANDRYKDALQLRKALLRADPSALPLDAPMVAVVMRSMLGDELDRRRAGWPREVAVELEVAGDVTAQKWSLDELTSDNVVSAALGTDDDPSVVSLAALSGFASLAALRAAIPSERAARASASEGAHAHSEHAASTRTTRAAGLGAFCLALGVFVGTFLSRAPAPTIETRVQPVQRAAVEPAQRAPIAYSKNDTTFTTRVDPRASSPSSRPVIVDATARESPEPIAEVEPVRTWRSARREPGYYRLRRVDAARAKQSSKLSASSGKSKRVSSSSKAARSRSARTPE